MLFRKEHAKPREDGLTDYNCYFMSVKEKVIYAAIGMVAMFLVGYLFYQNIILSCVLMLSGLGFPRIMAKRLKEKRKQELAIQFKEMLYAVSSSLSVGKSVESALKAALSDLDVIYPDENTDILRELKYIVRGLEMNATLEQMLFQFSQRAHLEDIDNFADVFVTCKRSGGDLIEVIRSASNTIADKIEIKAEIATTLSDKKMEFNVLMIMPIVMVAMLSYIAEDYMAPVFHSIAGHLVMTIAIGLFIIAYIVGKRIMNVEV